MKWREVARKLVKSKFTKGRKSRHYQIYNCPCSNKEHPVGVTNHLPDECRQMGNVKRQLGPHLDNFLRV